MVPAALQGLEQLIAQHEQRLHNGPPELTEKAALDSLRELHVALGELLATAERGEALQGALGPVRKLVAKIFGISRETGDVMVAGLPAYAASTLAALATWKGCEVVLGMGEDAAITMAVGAGAALYAGAATKRK